ncbi:MAG TPA: DUF4058 family protein [Pirellulales bacterium]|nr:DUF4058 family protein [Pirellulales bacterium]
MPLRDHFRAPLNDLRHWESMHAMWPAMIVANLRRSLPKGFFAELQVHSGRSAEIDVATYEEDHEAMEVAAEENGGGVATAVWAPPQPTLSVFTDLPAQDVYEVQVYDETRRTRLVAAVELASPANKDRPETRRIFAAKCAALLRERVSVVIVDVVTTRTPNLYAQLLELIGESDPALGAEPPELYASACRMTKRDDEWLLESWLHALALGSPLPTVPLWVADNLAVPLELAKSYEESCEILGIP